jgi:outer membrane protein assembly factor BamB
VSKISILILILLFLSNCSNDKKQGFFSKNKSKVEKIEKVQTILTKQERKEREFNPTLKIKVSNGKYNKNFHNNQNDVGELSYKGELKKKGKYKFSKFDNFENIDVQPVFYNENVIFSDNKGKIILYNENQKKIWKKNFYNKSERKIKPRLNFARYKDILIVTDSVAKYYAINISTGEIIWSKNNIVPFNSHIKIKNDRFYVVDYKNILRSISIKDGSEFWNLKTTESLTKSNTKISIAIKGKNIYFNNSIGDITAVNLKSGQLIWQLPTQSNNISNNAFQLSSSKLVVSEKSIFFSNNKNEFYSIDLDTGLINCKNKINSNLQPIIIDKFVITVSKKGYLYIVEKKTGNIIRINDLHKDYKIKKRVEISTTGFLVARNKIYLSNNNGKLLIADLSTGNVLNTIKISGSKILKPYIHNNNLFLIKNGSIIKFN